MARIFVFLLLLFIVAHISTASTAAAEPSKIDAALIQSIKSKSTANILVSFTSTKSILHTISQQRFSTRSERSTTVYNTLTKHAINSQVKVQNYLESIKTAGSYQKITFLWITNQLGIQEATRELIDQLSTFDEVNKIQEEQIEFIVGPVHNENNEATSTTNNTQWGVAMVQAPEVWAQGYNGTGIIVANIDTGVRYTHEILVNSYANDGHSWFDPYGNTEFPADYHSHGTHTMGTIVGSNGYGVTPGSKWIACKGLSDSGSGSSTHLIACGQYLICPTRPNGTNPDCSKTPHVVCNSWGGSGGRTLYDEMIEAWHIAGIIPTFSNGNNGPSCNTTGSPGDRNVIGVGSTHSADGLSSFSSRGPSYFNELKPDISAPGQSVLSAAITNDTAYSIKSGTSMACPHVTGVIALLLNQNGSLSYTQVKNLIQNNAERNLTFEGLICNGTRDNEFPNYHFGYGRINVLKAAEALASTLIRLHGFYVEFSWILEGLIASWIFYESEGEVYD